MYGAAICCSIEVPGDGVEPKVAVLIFIVVDPLLGYIPVDCCILGNGIAG